MSLSAFPAVFSLLKAVKITKWFLSAFPLKNFPFSYFLCMAHSLGNWYSRDASTFAMTLCDGWLQHQYQILNLWKCNFSLFFPLFRKEKLSESLEFYFPQKKKWKWKYDRRAESHLIKIFFVPKRETENSSKLSHKNWESIWFMLAFTSPHTKISQLNFTAQRISEFFLFYSLPYQWHTLLGSLWRWIFQEHFSGYRIT